MTQTYKLPNSLFIPRIKDMVEANKHVVIRVRGNSMRPFWHHNRDKVTISPCQHVTVGDVVLAKISQDNYVAHRVIKKDGTALTLMGDGNIRGVEHCDESEVIGKITQFTWGKSERVISVDSRLWRTYSHLWLLLRPLRRILLAIDRRIFKNTDLTK